MNGEQLREAREARRLSVPELARISGISSDTIRRIESGAFSGRARTWRSIEAALGARAEEQPEEPIESPRTALARLLDRYGEPLAAYLLAHAEHFRGFARGDEAALVGAR